ncbi:MAG: ISAs1 family transposase, partial [Deinococcota bacterium]
SLRHTALNILKQDNSKASTKSKRKRAGWDRDYLLSLLGLA